MQTLDAPVYEVNKDSDWYKKAKKRNEDINDFFKKVNSEYGLRDGFGFYHSEYFGINGGTEDYKTYKNELLKNPSDSKGFYPFRKRSKYYKPIKEMIEQIEEVSPFKPHDTFGLNNISGSQWVGDRWFFGIKHEKHIKSKNEITSMNYKDYLKVIMSNLD